MGYDIESVKHLISSLLSDLSKINHSDISIGCEQFHRWKIRCAACISESIGKKEALEFDNNWNKIDDSLSLLFAINFFSKKLTVLLDEITNHPSFYLPIKRNRSKRLSTIEKSPNKKLASDKKLIFISCGQLTKEEKEIGLKVKRLIDKEAGFKGYFAQAVQSLDGLTTNIFDALLSCSGLVVFLHKRGKVSFDNGEIWGNRSSVWVNQEVAMLAFRAYIQKIKIPIIAFQDDVKIEGAMTGLIVNPQPFSSDRSVLSAVKEWLQSDFAHIQESHSWDEVFIKKWESCSTNDRLFLKALLLEGGSQVKEAIVRSSFRELTGLPKVENAHEFIFAKNALFGKGLIQHFPNLQSGDELSLHPNWVSAIKEALMKFKHQPVVVSQSQRQISNSHIQQTQAQSIIVE